MVQVVVGGHWLTRLRPCDMKAAMAGAVDAAHSAMSNVAHGQTQSSMGGLNA